MIVYLVQWRIQDFSQGVRQLSKVLFFFNFVPENCMKMKEFGPGGGRVPGAPLDPPMWWSTLADPRGGAWTQASPVQYLSFSCSFWQNSCQIIGFCPEFRSWLWEILDPPLFYFLEKQLSDLLVPDPDHHHYLSDRFDFFEYLIRLQVIVLLFLKIPSCQASLTRFDQIIGLLDLIIPLWRQMFSSRGRRPVPRWRRPVLILWRWKKLPRPRVHSWPDQR